MEILIVGGGVAGLSLAALLRQHQIKCTLIEKVPAYKEVGYVICLWPLGSRILHGLGLYADFCESAQELPHYLIHDPQGKLLNSYSLSELTQPYGGVYGILRSELLDILLKGAGPVNMNLSVEMITQQADKVEVTFSDQSQKVFDLVIGADGVHSQVRKLVFNDNSLFYTGWGGWAWWVDPEATPLDEINEYWGPAEFFGLYPAKNKLCCFACVPHPEAHGTTPVSEIQNTFKNFGGAVPQVLAKTQPSEDIYYTGFYDTQRNVWNKGRVVMIGDAGQLMLPTAGVGASMAMESAAVLADELSRVDAKTIPLAINFYIQRHQKRLELIQNQSRFLGKLMTTASPMISYLRNQSLRFYSQKTFFKPFEKILKTPL